MKFRKKAPLIEATQWLKHGDHSQVQNFQAPDEMPGSPYCPVCGNLMRRGKIVAVLLNVDDYAEMVEKANQDHG